jgi:GH15 family glucan-1,4-alpha-glucosidase
LPGFWRSWLGRATFPDHPLGGAIRRSALAIKGLTYMPTGATVAALTTSLPETPGGERNWDYRYTWIRDATFTLQALHYLDLDWEADEVTQFVADLEPNQDGGLQIMYGIDGRRDLTVLAIADELTERGFVLRYRTDETDDGLSGKEPWWCSTPPRPSWPSCAAGSRNAACTAPARWPPSGSSSHHQ